MRIGIFGGSFNPPHNAHLQLCEFAKKTAFLDKIILIPTGDNPFKMTDETVRREHRLQMTKLAFANREGYEVSDIEIRRKGQSYTIDTVKQIQAKTNDELFFISGSDILFQLPQWKDFDLLSKRITFICAARRQINNTLLLEQAEVLQQTFGAAVILLEEFQPDEISSSVIREMVREHSPIGNLVPQDIDQYISDNHLYQAGNTL
ncbi:MAG: nicotinate-nucleotide adenylyltransferase [Anaerofustis sp.]